MLLRIRELCKRATSMHILVADGFDTARVSTRWVFSLLYTFWVRGIFLSLFLLDSQMPPRCMACFFLDGQFVVLAFRGVPCLRCPFGSIAFFFFGVVVSVSLPFQFHLLG